MPLRVVTKLKSSSSLTINLPASLTSEIVNRSPSTMLTVMYTSDLSGVIETWVDSTRKSMYPLS